MKMRMDLIKRHFFENRAKYDMQVHDEKEISCTIYAINTQEYGKLNYLIGDKTGFRYLLQKGRNEYFDSIHRERLRSLRNILMEGKCDHLMKNMLAWREVEISSEPYLMFDYVHVPTVYAIIRGRLLWRTSTLIHCVDRSLDFCLKLEQAKKFESRLERGSAPIIETFRKSYGEDEYNQIRRDFEPSIKDARDISFSVGIVHNDLGTTNFIMRRGKYWVVDWEYWSTSLEIFNFFDVLCAYSSLLTVRLLARRSIQNFLSAFRQGFNDRKQKLLRKCGEYAKKIGYDQYSPSVMENVFFLYLMNKSICQYRVYGCHFSFDQFWFSILKQAVEDRSALEGFWDRMITC